MKAASWELLLNPPESPLQLLEDPLFAQKKIRVGVKRDDLLVLPAYPGDIALSGNKWRKLAWNLQAARTAGFEQLLTFGGAFSNHLAAVASAGARLGFQTIGVVRGEPTLPLNPTLAHAQRCGMQLHYLSRSDYRSKMEAEIQSQLAERYGKYYLLPEGGTNHLALEGIAGLATEIQRQCMPDAVLVAGGTGGTFSGLASALPPTVQLLGVPVLKGDFLPAETANILGHSMPGNTHWFSGFHHGGYGRFTPELLSFITQFYQRHGFALDPIYTSKVFYALYQLIEQDYFTPGSTIVVIHTGGLQGIAGFNQRHGLALPVGSGQ